MGGLHAVARLRLERSWLHSARTVLSDGASGQRVGRNPGPLLFQNEISGTPGKLPPVDGDYISLSGAMPHQHKGTARV